MAWQAKVLGAVILAVFALVAGSACSAALAQTDEELAAGFTADTPNFLVDVRVSDGGLICQQINITLNDCHDPSGNDFPLACCFFVTPPNGPTQLDGPGCWEFGPSIEMLQQVGKGFCCARFSPGYGPTDWRRFEDLNTACGFCGGKTPTADECCTPKRDVVPKTPITNLEDCPGRVQKKDPDHTTPACGPAQAGPIKRAVIPQRYANISFEPGCIAHDKCYSTCRQNKGSCDVNLHDQLRAACDAYYLPRIEAFKKAGADGSARIATTSLQNCRDMADDFLGFVSSQGQEAFDTAQKDYCKCCD